MNLDQAYMAYSQYKIAVAALLVACNYADEQDSGEISTSYIRQHFAAAGLLDEGTR